MNFAGLMIEAAIFVCDVSFEVFSLVEGAFDRLGILSMQESPMSTGCNELLGVLYSGYIFGSISKLSSLSLLWGEGSSSDEENTMRCLLDNKSE